MKKIGFSSYPDFSGNNKALYEDMCKEQDKYDLVWFCKDENVANRLNKKGIRAIWDKAENFEEEFNKVEIVVITHDDYLDLKNDNQIFINLWHGLGPKKSGVLSERETDWIYNFSTKVDYLIATSEFGRFVFSSVFNIPLYRVKQFPQARYKWIFESKGRKNLERLLKKDLKEYKKIIMYAPTFKKGIGREDTKWNHENMLCLDKYDEKVLINYLEKNNFLLILKLHPVEENKLKEITSNNIINLSDNVLLENFITINEVLDGIDLLISDYSSIYIDYINLERPILFLDTDKKEFITNRGIIFDSLDFWQMAGPKVHTVDTCIEELNKLLTNQKYYSEQRKKFNKLVNGKVDKTNDQLIDFIKNIEIVENKKDNIYATALLEKKNRLLQDELNNLNNVIINNLNDFKIHLKDKDNEIKELNNEINYIKNEYKNISIELESIKYSRSYKLITKAKKIFLKK